MCWPVAGVSAGEPELLRRRRGLADGQVESHRVDASRLRPEERISRKADQILKRMSTWGNLDPADPAGGLVCYEEPAADIGRATYDGVFAWGTSDAHSIQIT